MDALSLLRRSRAHKRNPSPPPQPPFQIDIQPIIAGIENASDIDPNHRRSNGVDKRMTPEELKEIQASMSQSVARAVASASQARAAGATSARLGANAATIGTTIARLDQTQAVGAAPVTVQSSSRAAASSSAVVIPSSSSRPSSSTAPSSSSSSRTTTSTSTTPTSTAQLTSTTQVVLTVTSNRASSSSSSSASASPLASIAAASASASTTGLGTGPIVGIALAGIVGVVVIGSAVGWLYRKRATRSYSEKAPWSKLDDNDVTPFAGNKYNEKPYNDDVYGRSDAPVIGSGRALTMARQNAFNADGSARPDSDYMIQREGNRAGWGAGATLGQYSAYPDLPPAGYGTDAQGRPYNAQGGRVPMSHGFQDQDAIAYSQPGRAITSPGVSAFSPPGSGTGRQLLGPGQQSSQADSGPYPYQDQNQSYPQNGLIPMPIGKPSAPTTNNDIADLEEFADMPDSHGPARTNNNSTYSTYGLAYAGSEPDYTPRTATTMGEWAGDARPLPQAPGQAYSQAPALPEKVAYASPVSQHQPLPTLVPVSPLMSSFGGLEKRQSAAPPLGPLAASFANKYGSNAGDNSSFPQDTKSRFDPTYADEDEHSRQKRMYGEISQAAGFPEPRTPYSPTTNLNASTSSQTTVETTSSFSAHGHAQVANSNSSPAPAYTPGNGQRLPPMPIPMPSLNLSPPRPYQHGQPLSPLPEVATPASTFNNVPLSSSSLNHGQNEVNPFERMTRHSGHGASGSGSGSGPTLLTPASKRLSGGNGHNGLIPPAPYSAVSSTGATAFPSPRFPPPSPGGMSVPGSINDSPRGGRRVSFDEEDAYGGI